MQDLMLTLKSCVRIKKDKGTNKKKKTPQTKAHQNPWNKQTNNKSQQNKQEKEKQTNQHKPRGLKWDSQ